MCVAMLENVDIAGFVEKILVWELAIKTSRNTTLSCQSATEGSCLLGSSLCFTCSCRSLWDLFLITIQVSFYIKSEEMVLMWVTPVQAITTELVLSVLFSTSLCFLFLYCLFWPLLSYTFAWLYTTSTFAENGSRDKRTMKKRK